VHASAPTLAIRPRLELKEIEMSWFEKILRIPGTRELLTARTHLVARGFDWRYRVDTRGRAKPREMQVVGDQSAHANEYWATTAKFARRMIRGLPIADMSSYTFVDMGSGKGRVLLIAAEFSFRRIIGVEFALGLDAIAHKNVETYRNPKQQCANIQPVLMDATQYDFPPEPLVVYFYNPFEKPALELVIRNLDRSIAEYPRDVIVVYWNPTASDVIEQARHLKLYAQHVHFGQSYNIYRSTLSV
jgi:hypothetical protein